MSVITEGEGFNMYFFLIAWI